MAVGGGARDRFGAYRTAGTAAVIDNKRLAVFLGQTRCEQTGHDVRVTAGWKRYDDAYRPVWPRTLRESRWD